uniref:Uncharacterized protein n=1 Tax=Poecilia reticulata TaxID=8081 RepID=A0A3P9PVL2_POERE
LPSHKHIHQQADIQAKTQPLDNSFRRPPIFDNDDYECRTPESWLSMGKNQKCPERKPIPALALLLTGDYILFKSSYPEYKWHLVGVLDYCTEKLQKKRRRNVTILYGGTQHWIPRIRLLFKAEDPRIFANRIESALRLRKDGEIQLLYSTSVDCMPIWEANPSLSHASLQRIKGLVKSRCIKNLENQAKLEYDRVMNRMVFDSTVMTYSEEFSDIILPQKDPEKIPENRAALLCSCPNLMLETVFCHTFFITWI